MTRSLIGGFAAALVATALALPQAHAQSSGAPAGPAISGGGIHDMPDHRTWEYGPFLNGGKGLFDRSSYYFFSVGFQAGRNLTPVIRAGPLSGRFEMDANIMPLWQAYTPSPYSVTVDTPNGPIVQNYGGGTFTGLSITPVIFRWNFSPDTRRFTPWFQAAGGSIYTTHKFPPTLLVPHGTPGGTSVFNFSPQGGVGFHYFTRPRRSVDLSLNAVHISSASLGDKNPGVNVSLQMELGYTWWK